MKQKLILFIALGFLLQTSAFSAKTYKIGCNENYYPYITKNAETNQLEGIVIDWWNLWAEKTGATIEFVPLDLAGCLRKIETGEIDAIAGLFFSEERAKTLLFSEPIMRMKTVLFLKDKYAPDSLRAIDKKIAVLKNDVAATFLHENYPYIELNVFDDSFKLRDVVQHEQVAGFVYDIPDPLNYYKEIKAPKGYYMFQVLYRQKLRPAVKAGNKDLMDLIIAGSVKISDEELVTLAEKWNFFKPDKTLLWVLLLAGVLIGIVFAFFVSKVRSSKKKIKAMEDYASKTDWKLIIDKGENDHIEFKSSVRWDYRQEKVNKVLEKVIAKTISAFLNTHGGMLFIGVDDDGNILGLDKDYNCLSKKNRDGFLLNLTNVINMQLGKSLHKFIQINIISINNKDVCIVRVEESDKPVFLGKTDNEEFYIRASASSQPLGVRETYKYINSHWK